MQEARQRQDALIEEYKLAGLSNCNDLLLNFRVAEIHENLVASINQRQKNNWNLIIGVIESDWKKVEKEPDEYQEWLD